MALTAGTWSVTTQVQIQGASIAPQGNASTKTLTSPSVSERSADSQALTFGTTSGTADIYCAVQNTLGAGASATYDIFTGTDLPNVFGGTAAIRTLRGIAVVIDSGGDASGVTIGGAASNATPLFFGNANDVWTIFPSGPPFAGGSDAGVAITNLLKNVKILNNGLVSVTFTIYLAGGST